MVGVCLYTSISLGVIGVRGWVALGAVVLKVVVFASLGVSTRAELQCIPYVEGGRIVSVDCAWKE